MKKVGAEDLIAKPDDATDGAEDDKPAVTRDTTIEATVKEAEDFLEKQGKVEGSTRAETEALAAAEEESKPPKVPKDNTMVETAKVCMIGFSFCRVCLDLGLKFKFKMISS